MTPTDRAGLQKLAMFAAIPIIAPAAIFGFLWQFIDYGWTLGNIAFNHIFGTAE